MKKKIQEGNRKARRVESLRRGERIYESNSFIKKMNE